MHLHFTLSSSPFFIFLPTLNRLPESYIKPNVCNGKTSFPFLACPLLVYSLIS